MLVKPANLSRVAADPGCEWRLRQNETLSAAELVMSRRGIDTLGPNYDRTRFEAYFMFDPLDSMHCGTLVCTSNRFRAQRSGEKDYSHMFEIEAPEDPDYRLPPSSFTGTTRTTKTRRKLTSSSRPSSISLEARAQVAMAFCVSCAHTDGARPS